MGMKRLNRQELTEAVVSLQGQSRVLLDIINLYVEYKGDKEEFENFLKAYTGKEKVRVGKETHEKD